MSNLTSEELLALVRRVFSPGPSDRALALLVDLPDESCPDTEAWRARREMSIEWAEALASVRERLGLNVHLYLYRNVGRNNADLPPGAWPHRYGPLPLDAAALDPERQEPFNSIFSTHDIFIAPTQFSATAPLKIAARKYGFRAATMPGFSVGMIPALRLDYDEIDARVNRLKETLDRAQLARLVFLVDSSFQYTLTLDLRHRTAHASSGLLRDRGIVGNLPSGEAYIVPYEGEIPGDLSRSQGMLPVQLGDEVVVYKVERNRAVSVETTGEVSRKEAALLRAEPAYGNIAELGLGVLSIYGIKPIGEILLDEKLGLHIAFGRSEHFGGQVGSEQFSSPAAVVHIDRVFLKESMPRILVRSLELYLDDGSVVPVQP